MGNDKDALWNMPKKAWKCYTVLIQKSYATNLCIEALKKKRKIVGNKAIGQILKRVFPENEARQIFRKTNISYPTDTLTYEYFLPPDTYTNVCVSGGKKCSFFGKFGLLCFLETHLLRFALLPYYRRNLV